MEIQKVGWARVTGAVILTITVASMLLSWHASSLLRTYVECQAAWSATYAAAAEERAQAAADDRMALDRLVAAVAEATSRDQARTALAVYRQTRAQADDQRAANPLPKPPDVCH